MSASNQSIEPYYMQFLRCAKCSHVFQNENRTYHPISLPTCNHTVCKQCIDTIRNQTKCPQDQISFGTTNIPIDQLPTNYPLLTIIYDTLKLPKDHQERYGQCPSYMKLDDETKTSFNNTEKTLSDISIIVKPIINSKECESAFSRSMIRKIFSLLSSQHIDRESRLKFLKVIRSLGEHICSDFILGHQNHQQLMNDIWSAVGFQNPEFYEPAIQKKVFNCILLFFKSHAESRAEDIVSFVLKNMHGKDRRDIRHIIDLLSGASCFQIKQERNSSLMEIKEEFKNYDALRKGYDFKIIQIAIEQGFCVSPETWSLLLYDDTHHDLSMQTIVDKLSTTDLFPQAIKQLMNVLRSAGPSSQHLSKLEQDFTFLSNINDNQEYYLNLSIFPRLLNSVKVLLVGLIKF